MQKMKRSDIYSLFTSLQNFAPPARVARDSNGDPITKAGPALPEKDGVKQISPREPVVEATPFKMDTGAVYGISRNMAHLKPIVASIEEAKQSERHKAAAAKRERIPALADKDEAVTIHQSDPEQAEFSRAMLAFLAEEEEITLHKIPVAKLRQQDNPDMTPDILYGIMDILDGVEAIK
jgi:hypothetical protein